MNESIHYSGYDPTGRDTVLRQKEERSYAPISVHGRKAFTDRIVTYGFIGAIAFSGLSVSATVTPGVASGETITATVEFDRGMPRSEANRLVLLSMLNRYSDVSINESSMPNKTAIDNAFSVIDIAEVKGLVANRIVADADGGICIYFFGSSVLDGGAHEKFASITCDNEGDMVAMVRDRGNDVSDAWEIDALPQHIERIASFVGVKV